MSGMPRWTSLKNIQLYSQVTHLDGLLTVYTPAAEQIAVYSATGALLYQAQKPAGEAAFRIGHLPKGALIVTGSRGWSVKVVN